MKYGHGEHSGSFLMKLIFELFRQYATYQNIKLNKYRNLHFASLDIIGSFPGKTKVWIRNNEYLHSNLHSSYLFKQL